MANSSNIVEYIADQICAGELSLVPDGVTNDGTPQAEQEAVAAFLYKFRNSPNTLKRYRTEISRLWQWAASNGRRISQLTTAELEMYEEFLRDPQPRAAWCMEQRYRRSDPRWRPFAGPLSENSIKHSFAAIGALMTTWLRSGYIRRDPLANKAAIKAHMTERRQRASLTDTSVPVPSRDRWMTGMMREAILAALEEMPEDTRVQAAKKHQFTLIIKLLMTTGLRIGEAVNTTQGAFQQRRGGDWWLTVVGKGSKVRDIPVPESFIKDVLQPWREFSLLSDLPEEGDEAPLLPKQIHRPGKPGLTERMALNIVKEIGAAASLKLPEEARRDALLLVRSSPHWYRHTFATRLIEQDAPIKMIMETMGHGSESVLRIYDHMSDSDRHSAVVNILQRT